GVVGRLVLAAGEVGEIGEPIAVLVHEGETDADIDAALGAEAPAAPPAPTPAVRPADPAAPAAPAGPQPNGPQRAPAAPAAPRSRIFASPIVRKIALEKGIDLAAAPGTGPNGRIVRRDLERLAGQRPGSRPAAVPAPAPAAAPAQA